MIYVIWLYLWACRANDDALYWLFPPIYDAKIYDKPGKDTVISFLSLVSLNVKLFKVWLSQNFNPTNIPMVSFLFLFFNLKEGFLINITVSFQMFWV